MGQDIRGKEYHIEDNKVIIMKKPRADFLPKDYVQPLETNIKTEAKVL